MKHLGTVLFLAASLAFGSGLLVGSSLADDPSTDQLKRGGEHLKEGFKDSWKGTKGTAKRGWHSTKNGARSGWQATKEGTKDTWDATKEKSGEAYGATKRKATGSD